MKSVFNKIDKEKLEGIKFPVLAESNRNGFVVMFLGYRKGVIVKGNPENPVGHYSECYCNVDDKHVGVYYPQKNLLRWVMIDIS